MQLMPYRHIFPQMFDDFFDGDMMNFTPAVNVSETKDHVIVEAPLAGIDPSKVSVEIEDNVLKISGKVESSTEVDEAEKHYYRKEIRSGSFYRAVALPKSVEGAKAEASYKQGILKISVPKSEQAKPRTIEIKSEE